MFPFAIVQESIWGGGVGVGSFFSCFLVLADFHSSVGCLAFSQVLLGNLLSSLFVALFSRLSI